MGKGRKERLVPVGDRALNVLREYLEAIAHAKGEAHGLTIHEFPDLDIAAVRAKTKLSQGDFAHAFGVAIGTLQGWAHKRRRPEGPARAPLTLIDHDPIFVVNTLAAARQGVKLAGIEAARRDEARRARIRRTG
jgi:putative transcriptional regulator